MYRSIRWVPTGQLGKGASATVHKVLWLGKHLTEKCFYGPKKRDMQQEVFLLVGLSHPEIFCPYFVMLPRIKVVPFLWNQWIWGSSSIDCSKEWRTMRPLMPHLSFLKQLTSCCKIAYIQTVWFIEIWNQWTFLSNVMNMKGRCMQKWLILGSPKEKNQAVCTPS